MPRYETSQNSNMRCSNSTLRQMTESEPKYKYEHTRLWPGLCTQHIRTSWSAQKGAGRYSSYSSTGIQKVSMVHTAIGITACPQTDLVDQLYSAVDRRHSFCNRFTARLRLVLRRRRSGPGCERWKGQHPHNGQFVHQESYCSCQQLLDLQSESVCLRAATACRMKSHAGGDHGINPSAWLIRVTLELYKPC